jgi:hypothetical protein
VIIQDHLNSCLARAEERINWLVDLEDKAFSLNTHYLSDYKSKFIAYYRSARNQSNFADVMNTINTYTPPASPSPYNSKQSSPSLYGISKALSGLSEMGLNGIQANDLAKLLKTDNMEPAIEIMADVRAYFQGNGLVFWVPLCTDTTFGCSRLQTLYRQHSNGYRPGTYLRR